MKKKSVLVCWFLVILVLFAYFGYRGLGGWYASRNQYAVETGLVNSIPIPGEPQGSCKLEQRMKELRVPGVSVAVVNNGEIEWIRGYGELESTKRLSHIVSITKIVTSLTMLSLIEQSRNAEAVGRPSGFVSGMFVDLDTDVRSILGDELWQRIDTMRLADFGNHKPTIRRLLSHTAGIAPDTCGYYSLQGIDMHIVSTDQEIQNEAKRLSGKFGAIENSLQIKSLRDTLSSLKAIRRDIENLPIPSTDDMLFGKSFRVGRDGLITKSNPASIKSCPGDCFAYSNIGFVVLQKVIEVITGSRFVDVAKKRVLDALKMENSTFSPRPEIAARGNDACGAPILGYWNDFPEAAAGGLWSTVEDLAKLLVGIERALSGENGSIVCPGLALEMIKGEFGEVSDHGLGFERIEKCADCSFFMQSGSINGFKSVFVGNNRGQGFVILTNSLNGKLLYSEIATSIAKVYGWSQGRFLKMFELVAPGELSSQPIDISEWVDRLGGVYYSWSGSDSIKRMDPDHAIVVRCKDGMVFADFEEGGSSGEKKSLRLIPLGDMLACYRSNSMAPYKLCRCTRLGESVLLQVAGYTYIRPRVVR